MTTSRRRRVGVAGLAAAVVLAWLNGLAVWWVSTRFELFGASEPTRGDHRTAAGACAVTAVLLFVGVLVLLVLRAPWWLQVVTAVGVGTQLALSVTSWRASLDATETSSDGTFWQGAGWAVVWPGAWPLLVVVAVSVVLLARGRLRASSSPAPR